MLAGSAKNDLSGVRLFVAWTLLAVFCNFAGWALSLFGALNLAGYSAAFLGFFVAVGFVLWRNPTLITSRRWRFKKRFRRPFPLAFAILSALGILGGILYVPNNYDGLAYRTPRVLQWLAEGRWHWIHSHFGNLNTRGNGFEWMTAPLFLFAKTDRFEFVINAISFLFFPGRIFAILARLNVKPRVAYYWMWIFPTAYGFLLQAGSIGNDVFASLWPLAALEFALRARASKQIEFAWLSILAAALMTSSKAFNILLLPAWGLALLPSLAPLLRRPLASMLVVSLAASISLIPTAALNVRHCGDWTGLAAEPVRLGTGPPVFQLCVNTFLVGLQNFSPPIFPWSGAWDRFVEKTLPSALAANLHKYFEEDAARLRIPELQVEEAAGLGFGVSLLLLTVVVRQLSGPRKFFSTLFSWTGLIAFAALGGAVVLLVKSGLYAPARYLLPQYFPILLPLFALPAAGQLVRARWWRALALFTFAAAALLLILSPARPLWPAESVLANVNENSNPLLQRAARVYSVYANRGHLLAPIRRALPPSAKIVGLIAINNPETSLWRPFGTIRALHIRREDSPEFTRSRGFEYVVIDTHSLQWELKSSVEEWLERHNGEIVQRFTIQILARGPAADWLLVRLKN